MEACAICGDKEGDGWGCDGSTPYCFDYYRFSYFGLNGWVDAFIQTPFRHCHARDTVHVYGKLDGLSDAFSTIWSSFTRKRPDDRVERCPQCDNTKLRVSHCIFHQGVEVVQSFRCYVCLYGCVTCYVKIPHGRTLDIDAIDCIHLNMNNIESLSLCTKRHHV